ncbi:MAG: hypothetical protein A2X76_07180 [Lysobacterales bacterium GWF1_69_6]|nr:MAG: hypothetical protein A2X76_07180 [Xanthomonadales bacterium GWF1_69_6]
MARVLRLLTLGLLCGWLPLAALAVEVRVDPRVEFAAMMCRLAGFEEYQGPGIADYDAAVDAHFSRFRDHPAIATVRALREEVGLAYNMPVELALATGDNDWALRLRPGAPGSTLDARWTPAAADRFLQAAATLWRDADAPGFFAAQAPRFREVESVLSEALRPRLDASWFERQYGVDPRRRLGVVAGLLNGPNSYGPHLDLPGGRRETYAVLATPPMPAGSAPSYPADQVASLLIHELHHPYVNPWVEANAARLEKGASALFEAVRPQMTAAAYGQWNYMLNESLVRAQVLRYYRARGNEGAYQRNLREDRGRGFAWVAALADALDAAQSEAPEGAPAFGPAAEAAVFAFFDDWGRAPAARIAAEDARLEERQRERQATGVQLLSATPALADGVVAPGEGELRLEFDRAMAPSVSVQGEPPEVTGRPAWDASRRVLVIPVRFAPGASHVLWLNDELSPGQGFRGEDGEWLVPREWRFRVEGAAGE